jgi:hypothetical protein
MSTLRRSLFSILVLVCAAASAAHAGILVGARVGASVASISGDVGSTFDKSNRTGFAGTGFVQLGGGIFALQPEVSYIQKGVKDDLTGNKFDINYVEAAALLKAGPPFPIVHPHAFAGVGADFKANTKTPTNVDLESVDWNAIFGADVVFNLGGATLVADGRYATGLKDISSSSSLFSNVKNRAWILSAGFGFGF